MQCSGDFLPPNLLQWQRWGVVANENRACGSKFIPSKIETLTLVTYEILGGTYCTIKGFVNVLNGTLHNPSAGGVVFGILGKKLQNNCDNRAVYLQNK